MPKITSKIKVNLELHKSIDDFNIYKSQNMNFIGYMKPLSYNLWGSCFVYNNYGN